MHIKLEYNVDGLGHIMLDALLQQIKHWLALTTIDKRAIRPEKTPLEECIFCIKPENQDDCVTHDLKFQKNKRLEH